MQTSKNEKDTIWLILFLSGMIAVISTLGALFIGEVMKQTPCLLCWYQRIAMFPLALILMMASYRNDREVVYYALPLAVIGGCIAAYHSLLFYNIIPKSIEPCGQGPSCSSQDMMIFQHIPLPILSLIAFITIICFLLPLLKRKVQ